MDDLGYDKNSPISILEHARKLTYRSLAQVLGTSLPENTRNRGDLGSLVEKYFFRYEPNSKHGPDFAEAGVELKTTGVLPAGEGRYKAKERLVLTMINFQELVDEEWESSAFLFKCKLMLILFYLYQKDVPVFDRKFVLDPLLFTFPDADLAQIKRDWEFIQAKVKSGKAHELSEGDTFYLGACRKGAGGPGEKLVSQPNNPQGAKARAFSLKQGYLNQVISAHSLNQTALGVSDTIDFSTATHRRFQPFIGETVENIALKLGITSEIHGNKGHHRKLAEGILNAGESSVSELSKAGIEMKTIRLNSHAMPRESMSFPAFSFAEIVREQWEESKFYERIERKFLFVVFAPDALGVERLFKVGYWNMPYEDRLEAERVWAETKARLRDGVWPLPKEGESDVSHVRPKARNGSDVAETPSGELRTKQAFWLNRKYIGRFISQL